MYPQAMRDRIMELLHTCNNADIARQTGASMTGVEAVRKRLGIENPYFKEVRNAQKQQNHPEVKKLHRTATSKEWPCLRLKAEWPGCNHHTQCACGHRCEAPGK